MLINRHIFKQRFNTNIISQLTLYDYYEKWRKRMKDADINNSDLGSSYFPWKDLKEKAVEKEDQLGEVLSTINVEMKIPAVRDNLDISFVVNTETLQVDGFSFKADSPEIYGPLVSAETAQTPENQNTASKYWSRIEPSFMGFFLSSMMDLFDVQVRISLNEAKSDLRQRELKIAITSTISELTKLLAEAQAREKMMEAMGSFMQAGLGLMQLASMTRNISIAKTTVDKQIVEAKNAVVKQENKDWKNFSMGIDKTTGLKPTKADFDKQPKSVKLKAKEQVVIDMEAGKQDRIQNELRRLDELDKIRFGVMQNLIQALTQTFSATFKTEQGRIQALKETEQGYHDTAQTNMQDAQKNRDAIESSINKLLDLLKSLFDMNIRSKMFRG